MSNCYQADCGQNIPVPTPVPLPPCEEGEACGEVVDAGCVVYTGEALPAVNVETNERLDDIIRGWAEATASGTQAIATLQTLTATPQGNGTGVSPLRMNVRVSGHPQNLLQVVDYVDETNVQRTGLQVRLNVSTIGWILTQIALNEGLKTQFCELIELCSANACHIATNLSVEPG